MPGFRSKYRATKMLYKTSKAGSFGCKSYKFKPPCKNFWLMACLLKTAPARLAWP